MGEAGYQIRHQGYETETMEHFLSHTTNILHSEDSTLINYSLDYIQFKFSYMYVRIY